MSATQNELDGEMRYFLAWGRIVLVAFGIVVAAPVGCTMYEDQQVSALVAQGAEPLSAYCAIHGSSNDRMPCVLSVTRTPK